jgi:hypothetical protein
MTSTTKFILSGDQPMAREGTIILMIMGMPTDVNPVPTEITVVARMKMIVVIPNRNMCPGEYNKDPLELARRKVKKGKFFSVLARKGWVHSEMKGTRTHRSILIEMQYTARSIPKRQKRGDQTYVWGRHNKKGIRGTEWSMQ